MKNIEIEVQVKLGKTKPLIDFLKKNAKFIGKQRQIDQYFTPKHRNFLAKKPVAEWFRLRNAGNKLSVNYKNWHYDKNGKSHYCDEYESEISDLQSFDKILKVLNFKLLVKVDKERNIYNYKNYEIGIDKIKGLGSFVEIEYKGNSKKSPDKITAEMIEFLKSLKVGKIQRNYVGYPYMLLFPKKVKWEIL